MTQMTMPDLFRQSKQEWLTDTRAAARKLLAYRGEITIEDVLDKCPRPDYIHRNTTGQVFKHPDFKMCGFTKSRRNISKGRWVMKWQLNESAFPMTMRMVRRNRQGETAE